MAWAAGFIDAEGSVGIVRRNRTYLLVRLMAHNSAIKPLQVLKEFFGGNVYTSNPRRLQWKPMHRWEINGEKARLAIERLLPFLIVKRERAELAVWAKSKADMDALEALNRRGQFGELVRPRARVMLEPTANDVAYLAGMIDGDGTLTVQHSGTAVGIIVVLGNSSTKLVNWVRDRFGGGLSIHKPRSEWHRPVMQVTWCGKAALRLVNGLQPCLTEKRRHAQILIALSELKRTYDPIGPRGSRIPTIRPDILAKREVLIQELRQLNHRGA